MPVLINKYLLIATIVAGLGIILGVGLLSGLYARPKNCIEASSTTRSTTTTPPTTTTTTTSPPDDSVFRLPIHFKPVNYNLVLKAFFEPKVAENSGHVHRADDDRFEGDMTIQFKLEKATKEVLFHIDRALNITAPIKLTNSQTGQAYTIKSGAYIPNQLYRLETDAELPVAEYTMNILYTGKFLPPSTNGLYKTTYLEEGMRKSIVGNRFNPTDARRAFPCFDEPSFKATFDFTIEHPDGSIALSNFPEIKSEPFQLNGALRHRTQFDTTFVMSSYVVGLAILPDDYMFKETQSQNNVKIRVFGKKTAVEAGLIDFALEVAPKILNFFENYFQISEAIPPKIDLIPFPDYSGSASENWGINGFRETNIYYSEKVNTNAEKQNIAFMFGHELSHYWVGNYVTCSWWSDLWLNEAMAMFFQYKANGVVNEDWDGFNQMISEEVIPMMWSESFSDSVPIRIDITKPSELGQVFSLATYSKGPAILRMLEALVGEATFQKNIQDYLRKYRFNSVDYNDFFSMITPPPEMQGTTVKEYMERWLLQAGFPVLNVELKSGASGKTLISLKQDYFLMYPNVDATAVASQYNNEWIIASKCLVGGTYPEAHLSGNIQEINILLKNKTSQLEIDGQFSWIKCNRDFSGYYLTQYSPKNYEALGTVLISMSNAFDYFKSGDRADLINSAFSVAYLGTGTYYSLASVASYMNYEKETKYVPWKVFTYHTNKLANILEHRKTFQGFSNFVIATAKPTLITLNNWNETNSNHNDKLLRRILIDCLCRMQDFVCLDEATSQYQTIPLEYFDNPSQIENSVSANLRSLAYKYYMQSVYKQGDWQNMLNLYMNLNQPQEKLSALDALSFVRLIWILDEHLTGLFTSTYRPADFFRVVNNVARNPTGRFFAWYFLRANWKDIYNRFGSINGIISSVRVFAESFENQFLYDEVLEFFSDMADSGQVVSQAQKRLVFNAIESNIFWVNKNEKDLVESLFQGGISS